MNKLREAAQDAIDVLKYAEPWCEDSMRHADISNAITALRAALADEPTIKESSTVGPYLLNGMRFKMNFDGEGTVFCFRNFFDELQGKWVALVAADDNYHLKPEPTVPLIRFRHGDPSTGKQLPEPTGELQDAYDQGRYDEAMAQGPNPWPEPTGERAELIARIKAELAEFAHNKAVETMLLDSVDMLEADGRVPLSDAQMTSEVLATSAITCAGCLHKDAQIDVLQNELFALSQDDGKMEGALDRATAALTALQQQAPLPKVPTDWSAA